MNRLKDDNNDECLKYYVNSDLGSWEEVVMSVARPPSGWQKKSLSSMFVMITKIKYFGCLTTAVLITEIDVNLLQTNFNRP